MAGFLVNERNPSYGFTANRTTRRIDLPGTQLSKAAHIPHTSHHSGTVLIDVSGKYRTDWVQYENLGRLN